MKLTQRVMHVARRESVLWESVQGEYMSKKQSYRAVSSSRRSFAKRDRGMAATQVGCHRRAPYRRRRPACSRRIDAALHRLTSTDESESEVNVSTVSNQIRRSVSAWIRKQTDERLKSLQENRHYSVLITHIPKDSHALTVSMRCIGCDTCVRLQKKDNSSNATPYLISNWCRHVKRCNTFRGKRVQQPTIDNFMSHCWSENASCSLSKTEYPSQISDSVTQEEFDEISNHVDRFVMSPNAFSLAPNELTGGSPTPVPALISPTLLHSALDHRQVFHSAPPSVQKEGQSLQVPVVQSTGHEVLEK